MQSRVHHFNVYFIRNSWRTSISICVTGLTTMTRCNTDHRSHILSSADSRHIAQRRKKNLYATVNSILKSYVTIYWSFHQTVLALGVGSCSIDKEVDRFIVACGVFHEHARSGACRENTLRILWRSIVSFRGPRSNLHLHILPFLSHPPPHPLPLPNHACLIIWHGITSERHPPGIRRQARVLVFFLSVPRQQSIRLQSLPGIAIKV
jgi:hypothetical protein